MKYNIWLEEWLKNYIKPSAKSRTFDRYSQIVSSHIVDTLGVYEIDELTPFLLQQYVTELLQSGNKKTGNGLSANTVNCIISVLQGSLKTAHLLGITKEYHANKITRPKINEKQVSCFSVVEQKKIENAIVNGKKTKLYGILLCLYTGLRIGELLALEWSDFDFEKGVLSVHKTCSDGKKKNGDLRRLIDNPKTNTSRRIIPFPKQLLPILKKWKKNNVSTFLVEDKGKPVSVRSYQRSFELLLKRLNIPHKGFHALRHTFATRALECGMDVKTLSEILGHKNPTITLNRYVHSLMEHKKEMINRLGKLL